MGTRKVSCRLWIETDGEGTNCPYFKRTRYEDFEVEIPEEFISEQPPEDQWSILSEAGETFEP